VHAYHTRHLSSCVFEHIPALLSSQCKEGCRFSHFKHLCEHIEQQLIESTVVVSSSIAFRAAAITHSHQDKHLDYYLCKACVYYALH
jgi:hypothetical protein